jgi:hypothetical protein
MPRMPEPVKPRSSGRLGDADADADADGQGGADGGGAA